ncbi:unnamed protein product [Owenia fusiformis]|uniref:Major facilitator superfamily (MFS) profile domain-containing protein n=1 Tax=Owenia fusiformis TaxID=6347 RepID=A0A8S4PVH4_OWEFU|nr:unnamed protein product [Owenia fusiformis]
MELDEALMKLGKFGKWQMQMWIIICISFNWTYAWHFFAIVFIGEIPNEFYCKFNDTVQSLNDTIPRVDLGDGLSGWAQCEKFIYPGDYTDRNTTQCDNGYSYNKPREELETMVTEWDLVCDREIMITNVHTVFVVGLMLGGIVFTALSDKLGRKPIHVFCHFLTGAAGISSAVVPDYYIFMGLSFVRGFALQGIMLTGVVVAAELFPSVMRLKMATCVQFFWGTGLMGLALWAYFLPNWRTMLIGISIPSFFALVLICIIPESMVWLISTDKPEKAERILRRASLTNNIDDMPAQILTPRRGSGTGSTGGVSNGSLPGKKGSIASGGSSLKFTDLFKTNKMRTITIVTILYWFFTNVTYFGVSLGTGALEGDSYVNFAINGAVEIPAAIICLFVLPRFGRTRPLLVFHSICGAALIAQAFTPKFVDNGDGTRTDLGPLLLTFYFIAKFAISGCYLITLFFTPELFPTALRNLCLGLASTSGIIGATVAPYISYLEPIAVWLPYTVFGALSICGGILVQLLPESINLPLPETIEDVEAFPRRPSRPSKVLKDDVSTFLHDKYGADSNLKNPNENVTNGVPKSDSQPYMSTGQSNPAYDSYYDDKL